MLRVCCRGSAQDLRLPDTRQTKIHYIFFFQLVNEMGVTLEGVLCTAMRGLQQNKATHLSCQAWCIFSPGAGSLWRTAGQGPQTA